MLLFCHLHVFVQKCWSKDIKIRKIVDRIIFQFQRQNSLRTAVPESLIWREIFGNYKAIIIYCEYPHSLLVSFPSDLALWAPLQDIQ